MDHERKITGRKRSELVRTSNKGQKAMEKSRIKRGNLWETVYKEFREGQRKENDKNTNTKETETEETEFRQKEE
jgi:hypothetical protein